MSLNSINTNDNFGVENQSEKGGVLKELKRYGLDKVKSISEQAGQIGERVKNLFSGALSVFKRKTESVSGVALGSVDGDDRSVVKKQQFFNIKKTSEKLAEHRATLTEQLVSTVEIESRGRVDQADWYEVGGMSANEVLEILRQILNRKLEREQFSEETKRWIKNSVDIFKPAPDETFAEYMERRFMKGDRLPSIYNDIINVVKIFNKIQNERYGKRKVVDRQMIGEMPAEKVFDILQINRKVKEGNSGIKFILNHKIKPEKGESLRRYFYRLTAHNRGFLREDGTIDEKKLRNDSDFKNVVKLLIDVIPKIKRKKLLGGVKEDIGYYEYYNPASNDDSLPKKNKNQPKTPKTPKTTEVPYFERIVPSDSK